ncbi:hypothetical protein IEQ34_013345 [Dendrobium chrysotoxum]|uniref:Uncharacterized protein n=1 Tax=Dendrobium chrysotoxum TaxID=161865 RepID=A0AAV7GRB8_DENCH|nr:hypothetical protein IEQ34_013345 [Dendrobium chrysotoxum]
MSLENSINRTTFPLERGDRSQERRRKRNKIALASLLLLNHHRSSAEPLLDALSPTGPPPGILSSVGPPLDALSSAEPPPKSRTSAGPTPKTLAASRDRTSELLRRNPAADNLSPTDDLAPTLDSEWYWRCGKDNAIRQPLVLLGIEDSTMLVERARRVEMDMQNTQRRRKFKKRKSGDVMRTSQDSYILG